jgi:hypothetical protein
MTDQAIETWEKRDVRLHPEQYAAQRGDDAMNLTDAIAEQIVATLEALAKEQRAFEASVREFESQGRRIIDGGQIDCNRWEYTDWRTGEVLATGRCKDHDKLQMPESWCHDDPLHEIVDPERVKGLCRNHH